MIGDRAFVNTAQHLQYWKDKADQNYNQGLYLLRKFEVKPFLPSDVPNGVKAILDSLVNALHDRPIPPHTLCILIDDSEFWCDAMLLDYSMERILNILINEVGKILEQRTRDLPLKCVPDYTTRIIISKLTYRPEGATGIIIGFKEKRRQFNNILAKVTDPKRIKTVSFDEITPKFSENIFLPHGGLSKDGYRQIWLSLSNALEDFDLLGAQKIRVFSSKPELTSAFNEPIEEYHTSQPGKPQELHVIKAPTSDPMDDQGDLRHRINRTTSFKCNRGRRQQKLKNNRSKKWFRQSQDPWNNAY